MSSIVKGNTNVQLANSNENQFINDVIGNKNDRSISSPGNDSLYGIAAFMAYYHVHSPALVYPTLAPPVTITSAVAAWTLGNKIEVIPADTITNALDIHWIIVSNVSAVGYYELVIYKGLAGSETEIGRIGFSRDTAGLTPSQNLPVQVPSQAANTRISASLASENAVANTVAIKFYYHIYPS